jgi:hypothetical protein
VRGLLPSQYHRHCAVHPRQGLVLAVAKVCGEGI